MPVKDRCPRHHDAFESDVVALRPAAREDDLVVIRSQQRRDSIPRILGCFMAGAAQPVAARCVAVMLGEKGQHRFLNTRSDGRRRVVVEVDLSHTLSLSQASDLEQASSRSLSEAIWSECATSHIRNGRYNQTARYNK